MTAHVFVRADRPPPRRRLAARLSLVLLIGSTAPPLHAQDGAGAPPPAEAGSDDEALAALETLRWLVGEDDRAGARAFLRELFAEGAEPLLAGLTDSVAEVRLREFEDLCMQLQDLEPLLVVRDALFQRRSARLDPDDPSVLRVRQRLAVTHAQLGHVDVARQHFEFLHDAWERQVPAEHPALLGAKQNLANALKADDDLDGALELFEYVYEVRKRLLPADNLELLRTQGNLANSYRSAGDLERALALHLETHAALERLLPADHAELLRAKVNLANVRESLGHYEDALALHEHVQTAWHRLLPEHHPDLIVSKLNLAVTRAGLGDQEGALALLEHVLAVWDGRLPDDHVAVLEARQNLAAMRQALGDAEGALPILREVEAVRERLLPPDHPSLVGTKRTIAITLASLGEHEAAHPLFQFVADTRERTLPPDHPKLLEALGSLASSRLTLGDLDGALEIFERVLATRERLAPADERHLATARLNVAFVSYRLGDEERAFDLARRCVADLPQALGQTFSQSPRLARTAARDAVQAVGKARFARPTQGSAELDAECFDALETARLVATSPLYAHLHRLSGDEVDETRRRLLLAQQELEELIAAGPGGGAAQAADRGPEETDEQRRERLERASAQWRIELRDADLRRTQAQHELLRLVDDVAPVDVRASAVASALPPGHVAVGITKLAHLRSDDERRTVIDEGPHYLAFVVLPGEVPRSVDLGSAEELEKRVRAWRDALGSPLERGVRPTSIVSEIAAGRRLRTALVDPLLTAIGDRATGGTLHVCLDDALFLVPLDALPLAEGADVPGGPEGDVPRLGDLLRVRYALSMARLVEHAAPVATRPSLLAVGAVDFDADLEGATPDGRPLPPRAVEEGGRTSAWGKWGRLSATDAEVRELEYQAERYLDVRAEILREGLVTESALRTAARGKRYVHLATHGWFMPETVRSILDEHVASRNPLGNRETVTGFAPLTLCGLVLSGANSVDDPVRRSARLLTAQELSAFDLSACDLAVLSACETHVGIHRAGQGIQSLQTALHMAGARTSITSLWAVQDWPTQSLMKRFYEYLWKQGVGRADALWAAKCDLRREGHPPRIWAGWVLAGEPD